MNIESSVFQEYSVCVVVSVSPGLSRPPGLSRRDSHIVRRNEW